jgi:hypothetical protein
VISDLKLLLPFSRALAARIVSLTRRIGPETVGGSGLSRQIFGFPAADDLPKIFSILSVPGIAVVL